MTNDTTTSSTKHKIMYRWTVVQHELIPELEQRCGVMTPKLERLIHVLDWVRIEEFIISPYGATGRPRLF